MRRKRGTKMAKQDDRAVLIDYAAGRITALEARRGLGNVGFGDLLRSLADAGLSLPRAPVTGREAKLARARDLLFPEKVAAP
jgi:hypothetical protein